MTTESDLRERRSGGSSGVGRLLAVFAHPDDETYLAGGTLARYAASGYEAFVLCATFGEAGRRGEFASVSRRDCAALRRCELEAACAVLGLPPPLFLGCADQALARNCWKTATDEVVRTIGRLRPDVVLTFGPDGASGHTDYVALSHIVTAAFRGAGVPTRSRQAGETSFQPAALYYVLRSALAPACCQPREGVTPPSATTTIAVDGFGVRRLTAACCHRSQRHLQPLDREQTLAFLTAPEVFHRAIPAWAGGAPETHFHGIGLASTEQRTHELFVPAEASAWAEERGSPE